MSFQQELLNEMNEFRTNPKAYAKKLEKQLPNFKGKTLVNPIKKVGMQTQEGADAYKEAIDFLKTAEPVEPLEPSKGLARISADFLAEVLKVDPNDIGNINTDEIIQKYGSFVGSLNRELDMGNETPEDIVVSLIVSDGDPSRSHRDCLLSTELKKVGIASGKHPTYRYCTIIFFCTKFTNNVDSDDNGFYDENSTETVETKQVKKEEGQTLKPKKVVLSKAPPEEKEEKEVKEVKEVKEEEPEIVNNDEEERDDVVSEKRSEKIVIENGKKKKIVKITRKLKDGSVEEETFKEKVE